MSVVPACMHEFVLLVVPQVLAQTYPERAVLLILTLLLVGGICRAIIEGQPAEAPHRLQWRHDRAAILWNPVRRNYLSNYRAGVMLLSCVAILAVDFPLFPRRFAKTETYGTGLMDLGVGCFIFASGVSSAAARAYGGNSIPLEPRRRFGLLGFVRRVLSRCLPLVLLGGSRLLLQRGLNYQEHVSEYGVHWNFFLTLAAVQSLGPVLHALVPHRALLPLSIVIIVTYQIQLSIAGLTDFVLRAPRDPQSFFSQNREGVLGVAGYFALYLLAEQVGTLCIWRQPGGPAGGGRGGAKRGEADARRAVLRLVVLDAALWGLMLAARGWIQPISRRLVNLPYVLWTAAHNVLVLTLLVAVDTFASVPATSHVSTRSLYISPEGVERTCGMAGCALCLGVG
jgi:phosphatidylinositol glycan class W